VGVLSLAVVAVIAVIGIYMYMQSLEHRPRLRRSDELMRRSPKA